MTLISTASLAPSSSNEQIYCGLDTCLTIEVFEEMSKLAGDPLPLIYSFERGLQGPYLEIMQRGFLVDTIRREAEALALRAKITDLNLELYQYSEAIWDKSLNPRSFDQLKKFFYQALALPEVKLNKKGERKLSVNREALEKLDEYLVARPFVTCITQIRDLAKQLDFLTIGIDGDNRFRAGYNIAGTETGRPSSSENAFGTGGNAQNIAPGLRHVFIPDPGMKFCSIDQSQAEARDVGYIEGCLFGDWRYLDNCESGDLHTNNAKLVWPELPWTGTPKGDREVADAIFYREYSYRDMAKRGGHLSSYYGTSFTMARSLKIPLPVAEEFQARFCRGRKGHKHLPDIDPAFPSHQAYWRWIAEQIQTNHLLTTPFGRARHFFGRPNDDTTLREGIAFVPQSMTSERTNLGIWRLWEKEPKIQLLANGYDSITFQYPEGLDEDDLIGRILEMVEVPLWGPPGGPPGRRYSVPWEAKIGWNWGNQVTKEMREKVIAQGRKPPPLNEEGLMKWTKGKADLRKRRTGLGRTMSGR